MNPKAFVAAVPAIRITPQVETTGVSAHLLYDPLMPYEVRVQHEDLALNIPRQQLGAGRFELVRWLDGHGSRVRLLYPYGPDTSYTCIDLCDVMLLLAFRPLTAFLQDTYRIAPPVTRYLMQVTRIPSDAEADEWLRSLAVQR